MSSSQTKWHDKSALSGNVLLNQVSAKDYKRELLANHANLGSYNDDHYTRLAGSARPGTQPGSSSVAGSTYTMELEKK